MEIGMRLKEAREAKNLSLQDIQDMTKIQSRYLRAIENGDFSLLPGSFYARAFIKEYAVAVGLDANELLETYSHELPVTEEDHSIDYNRVQRSRKDTNVSEKSSPIFSLLPTIIVVILIIGVAFVIYLFVTSGMFTDNNNTPSANNTEQSGDEVKVRSDSDDASANNESSETTEKGQTNEDGSDQEQSTEESTSAEDQEPTLELTQFENDESTYDFTYAEDEVALVVSTENQNWLEIEDSNGESLFYGTLQSSNSPVELDVSDLEQIYLRFGEPTTISIELNGTMLELSDDISSPTAVQQVWINMNQVTE